MMNDSQSKIPNPKSKIGMQREIGPDRIARDDRSVVTVGTFDGVHRGHQAVLGYLMRRARAQAGGRAPVLSFDPHPRAVLRGEPVPLLTPPEERADLLEALGLDRFILYPFTKAFSRLNAEDYVRELLVETVGLQEIVVGYDHRFGRGGAGDAELLRRMGRELGFAVDVISAEQVEGYGVVSSSAIRRRLLDEGDVEHARELLGRRYALTGAVVEGDRRGKELGFPTANLELPDPRKLVPKRGVYAVRARLPGESERLGGMMNIGTRPTFGGGEQQHLEVHLLAFEGDLYGQRLRVEFVQRLRDEQPFDSPRALTEQLSEDRRRCKGALKALP